MATTACACSRSPSSTFTHTLLHRPRQADRMILQAESGVRRTTHCPGLPSTEEPVGIGFWRRYTTCYHPSTMGMLMMTWSFSSTVKYLIADRGIAAGVAFRVCRARLSFSESGERGGRHSLL